MSNEYILSFSSFYKAAYARDVLEENGINSNLQKIPTEVVSSCTTGLYLRNVSIESVKRALRKKEIIPKGVFQIEKNNERKKYRKIQ